jgi:hypothetical protein
MVFENHGRGMVRTMVVRIIIEKKECNSGFASDTAATDREGVS